MNMFQRKSWLFLAIAFGLMVLTFFLPFERVTAQKGDASYESAFNGWELVSASGNVSLEGGTAAPVKRLTDETGAARTDYAYIYSLVLTEVCILPFRKASITKQELL